MSSGGPADLQFSGAFRAEGQELRIIRDRVAEVARDCGVPEADLHGVRLAVNEVVTNAITHAYGERAGDGAEVRVAVYRQRDELLVVIADDGPGMSPRLQSPGLGLGLPVIAAMTKRLDVRTPDGGGTEVHLVFHCPR